METLLERRSAPRAEFSGITFVNTSEAELPCLAGNLSESGMLLFPQRKTRKPLQPGLPISVVFTLPKLARWLKIEGKLVRRSAVNRRTAWAVKFDEVPADVRRSLRTYVAARQGQVIEYPN